jgi:hypothetical protein
VNFGKREFLAVGSGGIGAGKTIWKEVGNMNTGNKSATIAAPTLNGEELRQRIAKKAYERYLDRGQLDGYDLDDWVEAEQLVLADLGTEAGEMD